MFDIIALGELLIDFTPVKVDGKQYFQENPGGAPGNFLTMASKLGSKTAFIGKVGNDQFGIHLKSALENENINTDNLILSDKYNTTLAFVHLDENGNRSFSFYRRETADIMLYKDEVQKELLDDTKAFHFGSLSLTDEPVKCTLIDILKYYKSKGKLISYDPNYRALLWSSKETAVESMKIGLKYANILKVSDDEALLLTDEGDFEIASKILTGYGVEVVLITLGEKGVFYRFKDEYGVVPSRKVEVLDTTGAGDVFFGAVMHQIVEVGIEELTIVKLREILGFANAAASLCVKKYGGMPSIPAKDEIMNLL